MLTVEPVTLATDRLILRPMRREDAPAFGGGRERRRPVGEADDHGAAPGGFPGLYRDGFRGQRAGTQLPFTTVVRDGERVVGSTRYMNIDAANHRLEIGTTWIARSWQRSFVNTHAKFLMLRHAFETLGCNAVEFRTHSRNDQSRAAIERLGANRTASCGRT